jgi:phage shock protein A
MEEISLETSSEMISSEDNKWFNILEDRVRILLTKVYELKKERDTLAHTLQDKKEKVAQLEKKVKLLSQDREKVKTRIDQLLLRFKGMDI